MANKLDDPMLAHEEAIRWLAKRMAGRLDHMEKQKFDVWFKASAENRANYEEAEKLWHEMGPLESRLADDLDDSQSAGGAAFSRRQVVYGGAIAAGVAVLVSGFWLRLREAGLLTIESAIGEGKSVVLADGSTAHLGAGSEIHVEITPKQRLVTVQKGEVFFSVTKKDVPFEVKAANIDVTVLGTEFNVKLGVRTVTVAVQSGRVMAVARGNSYVAAPAKESLRAGDLVEISKAQLTAQRRRIDARDAAAWRLGRLIYHETPLEEVVADLNRQFTSKIVLGTPDIGALKLTGVVVLGDQEPVLEAITGALPLSAVHSGNNLVVLKRAAG